VSVARWLALKLDVAFLGDGGLFDCDHLAFHLRKLRGGLLVATYKKRRGQKITIAAAVATPSLVR